MESRWGLLCVTLLGFVTCVQGQRDFDLADAIDEPRNNPMLRNRNLHQPGMADYRAGMYHRTTRSSLMKDNGIRKKNQNRQKKIGLYAPDRNGYGNGNGKVLVSKSNEQDPIMEVVVPIVSVLVFLLVLAVAMYCQQKIGSCFFYTNVSMDM